MNLVTKYVSFCLLLLTSTHLISAQSAFVWFGDVKPKGKVDSVIITGDGAYDRTYVYNKRGQLITMIRIMKDRLRDTFKMEYAYAKNGRLISGANTHGGKKVSWLFEYIKRKDGYAYRAIDTTAKTDSSLVSEIRYNNLNQLIQLGFYRLNDLERQTAADGNLEYKYDIKGNVIESITYYGKPAGKFFKYDNDGEMTMITKGNPYGDWYLIFKYSDYDEMHNWTVQTRQTQSDYELGSGSKLYRRITYYK